MRDEERQAFLAAIVASPDDDLPRLIYADRLDESGDPLGEFIRLQVELADALPELPVVDAFCLPPIAEGEDGLFHSEGRAFGPLPALHEGAEVDLRFPGGVARGWRVYHVGGEGRTPGPAAAPYVVRSCGEPRLWSTAEGVARKLMPRARYDALRERERELWQTHGSAWLDDDVRGTDFIGVSADDISVTFPFGVGTEFVRVEYRRGFGERLICDGYWLTDPEGLSFLRGLMPIRQVQLTTRPVIQSTGEFAWYRWYRLRDCSRWRDLGPLHDQEDRQRILERLLAAEFPGVRFDELPAVSRGRRVGFDPAQPGGDSTVTVDMTWEPNARELLAAHSRTTA